MEGQAKNKRYFRNDVILISALLIAALLLAGYLFLFRKAGSTVTVTIDGEVYAEYSLSEDRVEDIYSGEGREQHNRLVIRDGVAFVESATCPDGICADHYAIYRDGESIVCLPHRLVITVVTDDTASDADSPDIKV